LDLSKIEKSLKTTDQYERFHKVVYEIFESTGVDATKYSEDEKNKAIHSVLYLILGEEKYNIFIKTMQPSNNNNLN